MSRYLISISTYLTSAKRVRTLQPNLVEYVCDPPCLRYHVTYGRFNKRNNLKDKSDRFNSGLNLVSFLRLINNKNAIFDALWSYEYYAYSKDLTLSLCFFFYVISYFDVFSFFSSFCHYDCLLLKIQPSFPDLVCNYKLCNKEKKIKATGALTPHSISNSTTLPCTVFLSLCSVCNVCIKDM